MESGEQRWCFGTCFMRSSIVKSMRAMSDTNFLLLEVCCLCVRTKCCWMSFRSQFASLCRSSAGEHSAALCTGRDGAGTVAKDLA